MAEHQRVRTIDGSLVPLPARTLCIHGDGPQAVTLLATLRTALEAAGFTITAH
ncbi:MAG: LamB/YcsF family protein [Verrucomicrobiales bacterium]